MKINFNAEVDNIKNDDEYFYVLGQVSRFICDEIENRSEIASRSVVEMFLRNSHNDYKIISNIKDKLSLIRDTTLKTLELIKFQRCLCKALEYSSAEQIKDCKGVFFHQGFFDDSIFINK